MNARLEALSSFDDAKLNALYRRVFSDDDGQLVLEDLHQRCWQRLSSWTPDPFTTAFHEGMRAVLLMILTRCDPTETTPAGGVDEGVRTGPGQDTQ